MIIKSHLCGIAVAFERFEDAAPEDWKSEHPAGKFFNYSVNGRPQGSLYSQHKRKIADATEFMRLEHVYKPRIFVLTSPGYTSLANEGYLIQKFTHNLRNGYGCKNYLWVREATQKGYPHFHFIADCDKFDAVDMSKYWSSLFRRSDTNSVRLGTAAKCSKCNTKLIFASCQYKCRKGCINFKPVRKYWIDSKKMAWYLCKYIGKGINQSERNKLKNKFLDFKDEGWFYRDLKLRTFAVSQELAKLSQPVEFKSKMIRVQTGEQLISDSSAQAIRKNSWRSLEVKMPIYNDDRQWQFVDEETGEVKEFFHDDMLKKWNWQYTGFANTYKGFPKEWKLKPKKQ